MFAPKEERERKKKKKKKRRATQLKIQLVFYLPQNST